MLTYHLAAFFAGFVLDLLIGDPAWLPHPIRLIGWLISKLEKILYVKTKISGENNLIFRGAALAVFVLFFTAAISGGILAGAYIISPVSGVIIESLMTFQILAVKSLRVESMKVWHELQNGDIFKARQALSMIVGRDTKELSKEGIIRAAVETVAENTSDGVIAPMIYLAAGGPVLGFMYKAVNTMDSMIGYKNERYLYFGRAAAKMDDVLNYIPSRISAWLMTFAAFILGGDFSGKEAVRIYKRDKRKSESPNSAQTEAVCAGALGIRLLGDAVYFGKVVKKPYIGDEKRQIELMDIKRANKLMYATAVLGEGMFVLLLMALNLAVR